MGDEMVWAMQKMTDMMTLEQLCREISISTATGRNWIKLGKIRPQALDETTVYFSQEYVMQLKKNIQSGESAALKSRRNKRYVSGNAMYHSYVSERCRNITVIENVLTEIADSHIELNDKLLQLLLTDCAVKLLWQRQHKDEKQTFYIGIEAFQQGRISFGMYDQYIRVLLKDCGDAGQLMRQYPTLFAHDYIYEKQEDILGLLYISGKNLKNRKAAGSYYTPTKVVRQTVERLFSINKETGTILDPCCGTGNFLLQLPDSFAMEHIFGSDIDPVSVKITRINMALRFYGCKTDLISSHIQQRDYLWELSEHEKYDYIIGNPPWGYAFTEEEKKHLQKKYISAEGSGVESYDLFVEKSLSLLKKNAVLSFILPEAMLNVKSHHVIRRILMNETSVQYIEFLGDIFDKVQCPSIILQIKHTMQPMSCLGMEVRRGGKSFTIQQERQLSPEYFTLEITDEEYRLLHKLYEEVPVEYLKKQASFALGIITGNNKKLITTKKPPQGERILKGTDIKKYQIGDKKRYVVYEPENFQQVAPQEYYRAPQKLLYRFISEQMVFAYDDKQTLSLNSCNIVIPRIPELEIKYVLAILNSSVAQFIYHKRFHSLKLLRSHIEQIPIPVISHAEQEQIIYYVDKLLHLSETATQKNPVNETLFQHLYEELDRQIAKLYHLTEEEYQRNCFGVR